MPMPQGMATACQPSDNKAHPILTSWWPICAFAGLQIPRLTWATLSCSERCLPQHSCPGPAGTALQAAAPTLHHYSKLVRKLPGAGAAGQAAAPAGAGCGRG